jgi:hypothetical protein
MKPHTFAALAVLCVFSAAIPRASVPIGVYAMVEKVVLEPNDTQPQRIQIWGAFAVADRTPAGYGPAQRGYLYYSCPAGQETICRNEWNDIRSMAGRDELIGFGDRNRPRDRVRAADERPASPSTYPIQMGVFKLGPGNLPEAMSARLRAALKQAR